MFMKMYARPLTADATSAMLHFVQATRTKCTREHVVNVNAVSHHNARIFVDGVTLAVKDEEILHATSQCSMEGQLRHKTLTQIFERTLVGAAVTGPYEAQSVPVQAVAGGAVLGV